MCYFNTDTITVKDTPTTFVKTISNKNHVLKNDDSLASYQWYNCNLKRIIEDSIKQTFTPQDSGRFAVILKKGYCIDTSACILYYPVGLSEKSLSKRLSLYPNPTKGRFTIKSDFELTDWGVKIRSLQGQLVEYMKVNNKKEFVIDIEGRAGVYFIELTNVTGDRIHYKVIKQ